MISKSADSSLILFKVVTEGSSLPVSSRVSDLDSKSFPLCSLVFLVIVLPRVSLTDELRCIAPPTPPPISSGLAWDSLVLGKSDLAGLSRENRGRTREGRGEDTMKDEGRLLGKPRTLPRRESQRLITSAAGDEFLLLIYFTAVFGEVDDVLADPHEPQS